MSVRPTKGGAHAARHRAPSSLKSTIRRTVDRTLDAVPSVSVAAVKGRPAAFVAAGLIASTALVGSQGVVDGQGSAQASNEGWSQATGDSAVDSPAEDTESTEESAGEQVAGAAAGARGGEEISRSTERPSLESLKEKTLEEREKAATGSRTASEQVDIAAEDPRDIARSMLSNYGWGAEQYPCLDDLWVGESNWDHTATNPTSGAYGIPQSLPAEKMATVGPDWKTNPETQIEWGLTYIEAVYGTPCEANSFKQGNNWY